MHRKEFGDLIRTGVTGEERTSQQGSHLLLKVAAMCRLECVDLLLQQTTQFSIRARHWTLQPVGREHDPVLLGIEAHGHPEELLEGPEIVRLAVGKLDFNGFPIRAAQRAQNIEHDSDRAIPDLVGSLDPDLIDAVAQHRRLIAHRKVCHGATDMMMQAAHKAA